MSGSTPPDATVTDPDKAIVWSNTEKGNKTQAERACREDGKQSLESTPAGRAMLARDKQAPDGKGIEREQQARLRHDFDAKFQRQGLSAEQIDVRTKKAAVRNRQREWNDASRRFAANARGNVDTYVVGAERHRTFRCYELPQLLKNENVTSINGIDRKELAKLDKTDAFDRICKAELERDRKREAVVGLDMEAREKTYATWRSQQYDQDKAIEAEMEARAARLSANDRRLGLKPDPHQTRLKPRGPDAGSSGRERCRSHGPSRAR